jgi:serine protease SohB
MTDAFIQLALFTSKALILFLFILAVLVTFFTLAAKSKNRNKGKLVIKNLNKKYDAITEELLGETLSKKEFKTFLKEKKAAEKQKDESGKQKNIFVLNFHGDIKASAVAGLCEEVTAILNIASTKDEVVVRLESAGGFVHAYGLAAAQLMRVRAKNISLTITVDKIAASGGYLMACIANKILSAPFAIIGSIGVIIQMPNFHRLLKDKHIDFVQLTAGEFKRTVTMFGENTEAGRDKLKQEIDEAHQLFKNLIQTHRKHIDIQKVATGEHWLGQQAINLNLVDEIKTSDDYLLECSKSAKLYEISYEIKKPFLSKLGASASAFLDKLQFKQSDTLY